MYIRNVCTSHNVVLSKLRANPKRLEETLKKDMDNDRSIVILAKGCEPPQSSVQQVNNACFSCAGRKREYECTSRMSSIAI